MAPPGIGSSSTPHRSTAEIRSGDVLLEHSDQRVVLLDGGFATQLSCHVTEPIDGDVLWSARFLATDKEAVIKTHLDFLRAGADLIITNSYQASIDGFVKHLKLSRAQSYDLIQESVRLAQAARDRYCAQYHHQTDEGGEPPSSPPPLIVGAVGPYGASLHDGSEYTGAYMKNTPLEAIREWHLPRIQALVEAGVDLLALETIPSRGEAETLVQLLKEDFPSVKAWLAFSVAGDGKSLAYNGEDFQEAVRHCYDLNPAQLVAVGVNCVAPRLVHSLLKDINVNRPKNPLPLILYPNSGESYQVDVGWINRAQCEPVERYVEEWLDLGVRWIGGCCRTYAVDIGRIRNEINRWQQKRGKQQRSQHSQS